jgi:8-oxo-dGTP diphosphatase
VEPLAVIEIFERILRDPAGSAEYHYVVVDYICRVEGGALAAGDDVSRVEWAARHDLPGYRITEGALAVIEKGLAERGKY